MVVREAGVNDAVNMPDAEVLEKHVRNGYPYMMVSTNPGGVRNWIVGRSKGELENPARVWKHTNVVIFKIVQMAPEGFDNGNE